MGTDGFHIGRHAARFFLQIGRQVPRLLLAGLVVAVATVVLVLILPPTADLLAARLGKVSDAFQKSTAGLIFVESPEVYTRQRLVNDRYLQDAWLREKLGQIDAADTRFVDRRESLQTRLDARLSLNGAANTADKAPGASADGATPGGSAAADRAADLPAEPDLPFGTKFALQASARDKIRELILENALDDRHDLSGNTLFGLKFDTSVIPGRNTTFYPAVIVRMKDTPLDQLKKADTAGLAKYLISTADPGWVQTLSPAELDQLGLTNRFADHFENWRLSLQDRIRQYLLEQDRPYEGLASVTTYQLLNLNLCTAAGQASPAALDALRTILLPRREMFEALSYILRMDPYDRRKLEDAYLTEQRIRAGRQCQLQARKGAKLGDFLTNLSPQIPLPDPWGQMFALVPNVQVFRFGADSAPVPGYSSILYRWRKASVEIVPELIPLTVRMTFLDDADSRRLWQIAKPVRATSGDLQGAGGPLVTAEMESLTPQDVLFATGWSPLTCKSGRCVDGPLVPWINYLGKNNLFRNVGEILDRPEMGAIWSRLQRQVGPEGPGAAPTQFCVSRMMGSPVWYDLGTSPVGPDWQSICAAGLPTFATFNLGAYNFLKRMSRIESYAYAAFPKGDVSGVVTETEKSTGASAQFDVPGTGSGGAVGTGESERRIETRAEPSIVNFAPSPSEDSGWNFDFGWAIVKAGRMRPMLASQIVLISVPGYLDSLTLETWQGFLDPRLIPVGGMANGPAPADLEARIATMMPTFEKRTIEVNLPPDYSALDGLMTESSLVPGPVINERRLKTTKRAVVRCDGTEGFLSIVIPGERLWRSSVVTFDGFKADEIEVMPDMRGLLARFEIPSSQLRGSIRNHDLEVWTSEGSDRVDGWDLAFAREDCDAPPAVAPAVSGTP